MLDSDESTKKFFQIHAYDRINKITIENINFEIELYNDNKLILDDSFFEQEGLLVLDLNTDKNGIFTFNVIINAEDEYGIITNLEFENQISIE